MQGRKIINGYDEEIANGRARMQAELDNKLRKYVSIIKGRIEDNFDELDALLANEEAQISKFNKQYTVLSGRLEVIDGGLEVLR